MDKVESKIKNLFIVIDGLKKDPSNDNLITHFQNAILDLLDEKSVLTESGYCFLYYDPMKDLEKINTRAKGNLPFQQPLTRLCLYFTIAYNLNVLFCGLMENLENYPDIQKLFPDDLKSFLTDIHKQSLDKQDTYRTLLKTYLPNLTDKYAKIFNCEKGNCFYRDIFGIKRELHIPNPELEELQRKATCRS